MFTSNVLIQIKLLPSIIIIIIITMFVRRRVIIRIKRHLCVQDCRAAESNEWRPILAHIGGTHNIPESADHRCHQPETVEIGMPKSAKHGGATPRKQLNTRVASLITVSWWIWTNITRPKLSKLCQTSSCLWKIEQLHVALCAVDVA